MELKVFWGTLRRRWYLTTVVVALTIGATIAIVGRVGPTYEAEGSALVFPPASSTRSEGATKTIGNPYLELAGVAQARDVVIRTLKSRTIRTSWEEDFPGMSYEATPDFTNSAPIILFTVEGGTSNGAVDGLDDLMSRIPSILGDLQDGLGLPPDALVTARVLTQDTRPALVRKTQVRAGLLAAAISAGLGLLLLALADSLFSMRSRARTARETAVSASAASAPLPDPEPVAEQDAAHAEDEQEDAAPVRAGRGLVDAELAVSPARSQWASTVGSVHATVDGHRFRNSDVAGHLVGRGSSVPRKRPRAAGRTP